MDIINIYIDGSCLSKIKSGGIGLYIKNDKKYNISEKFTKGSITNNRCELYAFIKCFTLILADDYFNDKNIIIKSDSKLCINIITKWLALWKKNGFKTSNKEDVKNQDLLYELDILLQLLKKNKISYSICYTPAHTKEPLNKSSEEWLDWHGNDKADKLAKKSSYS
jgi:ribonuclease HI